MLVRGSEQLATGEQVRHGRFGIGTVVLDEGLTLVVRFGHGIEGCAKEDVERLDALTARIGREVWDVPLEVINRVQAAAIRSVNDAWGVFSRSRIELLPHQLWVCRQVNSTWPTRWLVADDVGLGKTVEAGMILSPLLARGVVRRVLILCPASLVEQWQYRMRTMFDIRLTQYTAEADSARAEFWTTHDQVVASLQTLRLDHGERHQRLLEGEEWDMLMVDEAHHLNADEERGYTLGYHLVKRLLDEHRVRSMVFFTGTPHRGKEFGFLALLRLLRPDLFDARASVREQLAALPDVMIRNNKGNATDLRGRRLFESPQVVSETYEYSPEEDRFYALLTEFIATGRAYASRLSGAQGRAVMLVLIAMQKLASSSVAAIRRALRGRLARLQTGRRQVQDLQARIASYRDLEAMGAGDELARLEEELIEAASALQLMEGEEPALRALLSAGEEVEEETKIGKILAVVEERFPGRSVLFFTEYKATQSLLMSALMERFGRDCVTFINGDERAEDVEVPGRGRSVLHENREAAASRFNGGQARFLVSTEAGGEGIDLQERCHTLIHVDLPWNPMRLHQRVGRLNRYGQQNRVEVLTLRNPETVESLVWERLNEKLERITQALGRVMEEPEDMLQLVLGMTSPGLFTELFAGAPGVPRGSFSRWFDQKTTTFGGQDAVQAVRDLVGNANRFDFQQVSATLPRVDLADLRPFLEGTLLLNGRRLREDADGLSFLTPDSWRDDFAIRPEYRGMRLDRASHSPEAARRLLGVGHRIVDRAVAEALVRDAALASVAGEALDEPIVVFQIRDRVTGEALAARSVVAGIQLAGGVSPELLLDWQLLQRVNGLSPRRAKMNERSTPPADAEEVRALLVRAGACLEQRLDEVAHDLRYPAWEPIAVLWPAPG